MKKMLSVFISAVVLISLSSCDVKKVKQTEINSSEITAESIPEEASVVSKKSIAENSAAESVSEAETPIKADEMIAPPDVEFIRNIFDISGGNAVFTLDSNGKYAVSDSKALFEYIENVASYYLYNMLSEENFEENKDTINEEFGDIATYDEFIETIEEYFGDDMQVILEVLEDEPKKAEQLA